MKKIQEAWRKHIKEMSLKADPNQSRLKVAKKMLDYLFSPLQIVDPGLDVSLRASGNIGSKYGFLYWAVFGSKKERQTQSRIYRPKLGLQFAKQKVDMLMLKLTDDEEQVLSTDIDQLIEIIKSKNYPKDKIQIPVQLTGHPGVDPSFGTTFFFGTAASDWGMGGSIMTPDGKSYLLHTMETLRSILPKAEVDKLETKEIHELYFIGQPYKEPEPLSDKGKSHFSPKAFSYQDFLKSIGRGDA